MDAKSKRNLGILAGIGALLMVLFAKRKEVLKFGSLVIDKAKRASFRAILDSAAQPYAETILRVADEQAVNPFLIVSFMWQESLYGRALRPVGPGGYGDLTPRTWASWWAADLPVVNTGETNAEGKPLYMPADGHAGWGFGLMQIDWASNYQWLRANNWKDPYTNMTKGVQILKGKMKFFQLKPTAQQKAQGDPRPLTGDALIEASVAAYNGGEGRVLDKLKQRLPVDTATTGGNYSSRVLAMGAKLQQLFGSV